LDVTRGLAIVLMIFTHFFSYSINPALIHNILLFDLNKVASYISVPLFYFIIGFTLVISTKEKIKRGHSHEEIKKYVLVRAILIYFFGFVLNLYQVSFDYVWHWSTLQIISIGYLVTFFLLNQSKAIRASLIIVSIMIAFILAPFYETHMYIGEWNIFRFFTGFIFSGGDPFFPWIAFFLLGSIIAEIKNTQKNILLIGIPLVVFSICYLLIRDFIPITKYPASLTYSIICMTAVLAIYYVVFWLYDIKNLGQILFNPLRISGMFSLTIFMFHIILGREMIKRFSLYQSLDFVEFLSLYVLTLIIISIIGFFWEKRKFKFSLDWILKIASHEMLKKKKMNT